MLNTLTDDTNGAITISTMDKEGLDKSLAAAPARERAWLKTLGFNADPGKFAFLPGSDGRPNKVVVGANLKRDPIWALAGLPETLPEGRYRLDARLDRERATKIALGWALGAYAFTRYKKPKRGFATLVWPDRADRKEVERLAQGVFLARDLINTPAEDLGPPELAAAASKVARRYEAGCTVISGGDLLKKNYPTIHAVGRASSRPPCLIDLRWGKKNAPKVTLVGKGVCFDTGGLDLKPAANMLQMKKDMGGAAVVLGLASALMSAKAPIRLRVLIPAVENSVSANAIHPLDIVRTRSGKTVEIGNTDAEGRLILCDALAEADSESPSLLIDCATLTGAARVALGPEVQALFCNHDKVADAILRASVDVADPIWRLPLWKPYRKMIDSKIADFNNVADGPFAGSIIGALYLAEFVRESTPWAHLDIMASNTRSRPGRPEGGEATGLRALYRAIRQRFG
ncbi:MAG TPA: leucyl aminopeptidase family protein [Burkholderiales bacterium]|nr:leucyl aminopeptidase family protein [Burkholderiales bacterium]